MDIHQFGGISNDRIDVVSLAPATMFGVLSNKKKLEKIKNKYKLSNGFVLYVGDVNWNKNIGGLLKAFRNIKYQISKSKEQAQEPSLKELKLILVGRAFKNICILEMCEINDLIKTLKLTKDIKKLGFVPDEDLAAVFKSY